MAPGLSNGHMLLKVEGRVPDKHVCKYLENHYRQRLSSKGPPAGKWHIAHQKVHG